MNRLSPSQVAFALIGCGKVGGKRLRALGKGAPVLYACDLALTRAQELAAQVPGCVALSEPGAIWSDPKVTAVIISTVNASLAPLALAAIRAGKHVLLEKPGAIAARQLAELQAAATAAKVAVRLGYNHRFHPSLRQARTLIDRGALGPLMFVRGRYGHGGRKGYEKEWRASPAQSGGGELIDQGVHLIDLAEWFLGPFDSASGHAATYFWNMPVDDNAFISLRTRAGQTAWLHASCTEWKNLFSFEIYGREAKIAIDGLGGSYGPEKLTFYKTLPAMGPPETTVWEYAGDDTSWELENDAFVEDIRLGRTPVPGLAEGIRILEAVETIYRSSGYPAGVAP